jgi:hypothetical protein
MTERYKLQNDWKLRGIMGRTISAKDMIIELANMVSKCPHTKTHWIQELTREGV